MSAILDGVMDGFFGSPSRGGTQRSAGSPRSSTDGCDAPRRTPSPPEPAASCSPAAPRRAEHFPAAQQQDHQQVEETSSSAPRAELSATNLANTTAAGGDADAGIAQTAQPSQQPASSVTAATPEAVVQDAALPQDAWDDADAQPPVAVRLVLASQEACAVRVTLSAAAILPEHGSGAATATIGNVPSSRTTTPTVDEPAAAALMECSGELPACPSSAPVQAGPRCIAHASSGTISPQPQAVSCPAVQSCSASACTEQGEPAEPDLAKAVQSASAEEHTQPNACAAPAGNSLPALQQAELLSSASGGAAGHAAAPHDNASADAVHDNCERREWATGDMPSRDNSAELPADAGDCPWDEVVPCRSALMDGIEVVRSRSPDSPDGSTRGAVQQDDGCAAPDAGSSLACSEAPQTQHAARAPSAAPVESSGAQQCAADAVRCASDVSELQNNSPVSASLDQWLPVAGTCATRRDKMMAWSRVSGGRAGVTAGCALAPIMEGSHGDGVLFDAELQQLLAAEAILLGAKTKGECADPHLREIWALEQEMQQLHS
jgi:hypothetical protein